MDLRNRSGFAALCRRHGIDFRQCLAITGAPRDVVLALWREKRSSEDADVDVAAAVDRLLRVVEGEEERRGAEPSTDAQATFGHRGMTPLEASLLITLVETPYIDELSVTNSSRVAALNGLLATGLVEYVDDHLAPSNLVLEALGGDEWRSIRAIRTRREALLAARGRR